MIPFSDQPGVRRHSFPFIMISLVLLNVLVFVVELGLGDALPRFVQAYGVVPYEITTGRDIPPAGPSPIYLTLITSMFLHGGFLHIAGNMLFLWVFGDNVEDAFGHLGFLVFYFVCGILAGLSQVLVDTTSREPGIGASGAIAGVLAAYILLFPRASVRTLLILGPFITITRLSALILIGIWIIFQFVSGLLSLGLTASQSGGIAYWAHIGGFVAGLMLTLLFKPRRRTEAPRY
jgi:membrane associated rhomboid family serine protease